MIKDTNYLIDELQEIIMMRYEVFQELYSRKIEINLDDPIDFDNSIENKMLNRVSDLEKVREFFNFMDEEMDILCKNS
jgi:hypothetical protein